MKSKKRRITILFLAVISVFILSSCEAATANIGGEEEETQFADQSFMEDLASGLEARWALVEKQEEKTETTQKEDLDQIKQCIKAEMDSIGKYENETFEDSKLKEAALSYINALKMSSEALAYINADPAKYADMWDSAYSQRAKLLETFVKEYGLTVSEQYQYQLDDFMVTSQVAKENDALKEALEEMEKSISFELEKNEYGWKTYNAIVENTTEKDLGSTQFTINLLDADGVIVETQYYNVDIFKVGQKAKVEFMTDKDFASTEVEIDTY